MINEPSAVALDDSTGEVQAVGKEAKEMLGRISTIVSSIRVALERTPPELSADISELQAGGFGGFATLFRCVAFPPRSVERVA